MAESLWLRVKQHFVAAVGRSAIIDVAFLGAASDIYPWEATDHPEMDLCVFVKELSPACGGELFSINETIRADLAAFGSAYEFRIIRGPYKRTPDSFQNSTFVVHAAVFTEESYLRETSSMLRWSWKKYECVAQLDRLRQWATRRPTLGELLNGPFGIEDRLARIESRLVILSEVVLPTFNRIPLKITHTDNLFTEYCIAASADIARNHGRVLGREEADRLANWEYFKWYDDQIFHCEAFVDIIDIKRTARRIGYSGLADSAERRSREYLCSLRAHLAKANQ
jgi:hypothetical protein